MRPEEIVMVCTSDIAGQVRGKGFPAAEVERRRERGVAWTPTNVMITGLGPIAPSPWGAFGDLHLRPDWSSRVRVDYGDGKGVEHFVLADVLELDGTPWACCPRGFLKRGLATLDAAGLALRAAFEHEFAYEGVEERPNSAYNLDAFRRQGAFAPLLLAALRAAGLEPDTFMPEYGPTQYEVTLDHRPALRAADEAVILRELVRGTAWRLGARATFVPVLRPDTVGNGVHVHFSLEDREGRPVNFDPKRPHGIGRLAGAFLEGVRRKLPALCALSAASTVSYLRLVPHRWSAAYTNLGRQDREAGLRLCPVFAREPEERARQFHFEYRAADAAASPYLLLGGLVWAGLWGLARELEPAAPTERDPTTLDEAELKALGIERLPQGLPEALDRLEADPDLKGAMGEPLHAAYLAHKRFEHEQLHDLHPAEQCGRYREAY